MNYFKKLFPLTLLIFFGVVHAQQYPIKPIKMYVAGAAGDGIDLVSRRIAQKLSEKLGQQFIIENRPGAGGGINASEATAKATPDGYTLMMGNAGTLTINPGLLPRLTYDPVKDFAPITLAAIVPNLLVANSGFPVNSVADLITLSKKQPGRINFASPGTGTGQHLGGELFKSMANIDLVHVPYKGSGPGVTDLLAGQVELMIVPLPVVLAHVTSGKLKALGITSLKRSSLLPAIPTVSEAGLNGYDVSAWYGIVAPAGTPVQITELLNLEIVKILNTTETRDYLQKFGAETGGNSKEEFSLFMRNETQKWKNVIKISGIKTE